MENDVAELIFVSERRRLRLVLTLANAYPNTLAIIS